MAIDPSIALQSRPPQVPSLTEQAGQLLQLKTLLQQSQENDVRISALKQELKDQETVRQIMTQYPDLRQGLPVIFQAVGPKGVEYAKAAMEQQRALEQMDETRLKNLRESMSMYDQAMDEVLAYPPEQRQQAYTNRIGTLARAGLIPQEMLGQIPTTYDEELVIGWGNQRKRVLDDIARREKEAQLRRAEHEATISQQTAEGTTPITPYQREMIDAQKSNVTEGELALMAARGDEQARKALDVLVQNRIKVEKGKQFSMGEADKGEILGSDPDSRSILAQTGLSYGAFMALTGRMSQLARDRVTRNRAMKEAERWANERGVDISTMAAQYQTYNDVLSSNIDRLNRTKIMEDELHGTIENMREVAKEKGLGRLRVANVARLFSGQEVNDPLTQQYRMHLFQLRNELAAYGAATQGRSGNNITMQDMKEAESTIMDGIAAGSIEGLAKAVENSTGKMSAVMQRSVEAARSAVWELFGVGDKYQGSRRPLPPPVQSRVMTATNPQTGEKIESSDGGKTWRPATK